MRVNGIRYAGTEQALTTSYANYTWDWLTNPNTGIAWTEADVEGTGPNPLQEFGVRAINVGGGEQINCTQTYITVTYTEAGGGNWGPLLGLQNNRLIQVNG